jgi:hypothetical protein
MRRDSIERSITVPSGVFEDVEVICEIEFEVSTDSKAGGYFGSREERHFTVCNLLDVTVIKPADHCIVDDFDKDQAQSAILDAHNRGEDLLDALMQETI